MGEIDEKYKRLSSLLKSYGSVLVAYSGGVDSSVLLAAAVKALGRNVIAVTASSPTFPGTELLRARRTARALGVRHLVVESDELSDERFASNRPDRCYWCKMTLLRDLLEIARREGMRRVAVASHLDDADDYRPGERAVEEAGAVRPLREAGFRKRDIRELARKLGVPDWRVEASACLASRFPYGVRITAEALGRVEKAEAFLRGRGFRYVRVRCSGKSARIEVDPSQLGRFSRKRLRKEVVEGLRALGFIHVSLDLEGYRTGSLNRDLMFNVQ